MIFKNFNHYFDIDKKDLHLATENISNMVLASVFFNFDNVIFVVLPTLYKAQKYYDKLLNLVGEDHVLFYPADEMLASFLLTSSIEFRLERINTIKNLLSNQKYLVVTNLNGAIKYQLPKQKWEDAILKIVKNHKYQREQLLKHLVNIGYKRSYTITSIGEFSVRGSIIDIFPINSVFPVRFDSFDDEILEIKEFDINTQRSNKTIDEILILPTHELFYDEGVINNVIKDVNEADQNKIINHQDLDYLTKYMPLFGGNETIFDFVQRKRIYFIDDIKKTYDNFINELNEYQKTKVIDYYAYAKLDYEKHYSIVNDSKSIGRETLEYHGNFDLFFKDLEILSKNKRIIIATQDEVSLKHFKEQMLERHLGYEILKDISKANGIFLTIDKNALPLEINELLILTEKCLYPHYEEKKKVRYKSVFGESKRIKTIEELSVNDYVVHYDMGIGQYLGIETMDLTGIKRDYIKILYADQDKFYVPIEQISLIGKYASQESFTPKLTKLGTAVWEKTKQRVKSRIKDISAKLIKLYAARENSVGFAFEKDTTDQIIFESNFEYEETIDQKTAIEDVKKDMESTRPMDRLICGDVGYGKTEVALRGAFKAVMSGKQVAYLAPTTVLARQHFHTFKKRFEEFGAKIRMLSRFVTDKEIRETIEELKKGSVDIVIGTHRLLSKDIIFKDLGLLIIDEEQRFGVEHKERIKELRVNVDTITLTATPIPRTLQMSLLGIKDLSMIETPPLNRYPVQTYVMERHDVIIKEAIEREMARGGQVFYLYNRVSTIENIVSKINNLVPEARVTFAHGQMSKDDLENRIFAFIEGEYDCLVCTTIIETGIDIPNTNTLIIHDASLLGLSQLYQIRGRVGRSNKIAYAYLMYDKGKKLTIEAEKRLQVIKDFTELGSGFKIAMRDLSIRGAGDLLGSDQSGFIDSVGLDLYMKILEDEINLEKGIVNENNLLDSDIYASRYIDKEYISDDTIRLEIHKRIDRIKTEKDMNDLKNELLDRFGKFNYDLEIYMYERLFKNLRNELRIETVKNTKNKVELVFAKEAIIDKEKLFKNLDNRYFNLAFLKDQVRISISLIHLKVNWLIYVSNFLLKII